MIEKKSFCVLSSDGIHTLSGVVYLPEGETRGFFHVVHGMTEHIGRYDRVMRDLAECGFICFGYDNLGHGNTAASKDELGYIARKRGWELLAKDVKVYSDAARAAFGSADLPYFLMGHSMGSFIVRLAAERFVKPDGLIVMGTGGANPAAGAGIALTEVIGALRGRRRVSSFVNKMVFGSYNRRATPEDTAVPGFWLTTDVEVRRQYYADPFCTFKFSVSAMGDLIRLLKYTNRPAWFRAIPDSLPILLVAGEEDPVGNYGAGVRQVEERLRTCGKRVRCQLYAGARHEILNDFTYEAVLADILRFLEDMK